MVEELVESARNATKNWCHLYPGAASALFLEMANTLEALSRDVNNLRDDLNSSNESYDEMRELAIHRGKELEALSRENEELREALRLISGLPDLTHGNHCRFIATHALKQPSSPS